jgi:hypothetical protein
MVPSRSPALTRRQLLLGGGAATVAWLLGACGGDDVTAASTSTTRPAGGGSSLALAQFFGGALFVAGQPLRAPFGVADADGLLPVDRTPELLEVQLLGPDGAEVGDLVEVERHADGLPRGYFPLAATLDAPGIYTARTEIDGAAAEMQFQVHSAGDGKVIQPGAAMPACDTPTTTDPHGVTPICTNDPVCPLHDITLAEALAEGSPVALLVATPAFCQIAICGPVLDVLLDARDHHPGVRFLHAEVYADPANDPNLEHNAPIVEALGLHFEPCLVLVGADGLVVDRVDTIYDRSELADRLAVLA